MARSGYVDERIVEMQFDNQQFEKNANQSIGTLDKLKQSLNLDGAAKGFDELDQKARAIDFSPVQEGIAAIGEKFSFMGVLGFTAMQRISNALLDMGQNLGRTLLGLDGISIGFDRYAEKSGHVKTIMTATGESIENVSSVLDDLNWFTDETSYTFNDMVNTMGKFTSAGVKLDTAKEAVEGIALWAAESGQNAQTASRAMFQLSQAYGRGTIQLQDWMSVEQANMSTQKIQNYLIEEGGEVAKAAIAKYGGFRDSLRSGWLTTEVFNKVMQKYSEGVTEANYENGKFTKGVTEMSEAAFKNAQEARTYKDAIDAVKESVQTGWSHSFELMFGNAEESAVIWTDLANTLIGVADKFTAFRNDVLEVWNDIGGRDTMVQAAYNMFAGVGRIGNSIGKSFSTALHLGKTVDELQSQEWATSVEARELFSELEDQQAALARAMRDPSLFTTEQLEELQLAVDDTMASLNAMDRGHILKNISDKFLDFSKAFAYMPNQMAKIDDYETKIGKLEKIRDSLSDSLADSSRKKAIEDQIQAYIKEEEALNKVSWVYNELMAVVEAFTSTLQVGKEVVSGFIDGLKPIFNVVYDYVIEPIIALVGSISAFITAINNVLVKSGVIKDSLSGFGNLIAKLITPALDVICGIIESITAAVDDLTYSIENGTSPIPGIIETIKNSLEGFFGFFDKFSGGFSFGNVFEQIKAAFSKFLVFISPVTSKIVTIVQTLFSDIKTAVENLSFSDIMAGLASGSLVTFFSPVRGIIDTIKGFIDKLKGAKEDPGGGIKGFFNDLKEGITGLTDAVKESTNIKALTTTAGAVLMLSLAISRMSSIPKEDLAKAIGAVTVVFVELLGFVYAFSKMNSKGLDGFDKTANGILKLSAGLYIIGKAMTDIAAIDPEGLKRSIRSIAAILLELVAYQKLTSNTKGFNSNGMIKMAVGLILIVKALQPLAKMEVEDLKKGIISMGAILLELAAFQSILNLTGGAKGAVGMGAGMIMIATSMLIFAKAISAIGSANVDVVNSGLGTMAAVLAGLTATMLVLKNVPVLTIASGFLVLSVALAAISGVAVLLGKAKWQTLAKGVGALIAVIAGLGVVMKSMAKSSAGGLLASAAAMVIMSTALTLLTVPLMLLGQLSWESIVKGLVSFGGAVAIMVAASALISKLGLVPALLALGAACTLVGIGMVAMGAGLVTISAALPAAVASIMSSLAIFIAGLGGVISALALTLASSSASIVTAIVILGKAIIDAFVQLVPPLVEGILYLITSLLQALAEYSPLIFDAFIDLILGLLNTIRERLPEIIDTGAELAISFIGGIAQGIMDHTDEAMAAMGALIGSLVYFALSALQELASQIPFVGDDIAGALEGVKNSVKEKVDSAEFEEAGKAGGDRLDRGLNSKKNDIKNTGISLSDEGITGVLSKENDWGTSGTDLATKFGDMIFHEGGFINSAGVHLGEEGSDGIDSTKSDWEGSGNYTVDGLYETLMSKYNMGRVYDAGYSLGGSANAGYNSALMISSPSRKMMWSAEMTIAGLVKGFDDFGYRAAGSGTKLGEGVLDAISTTLSTIDSVMDEDDFSPVISPVLDLTNVEQGAGRLDTLLASRRVGVTASAFGSRFADPATAVTTNGNSVVIQNLTVNGTENMNVNELSDAVIDKLNRQIASENSRWAY